MKRWIYLALGVAANIAQGVAYAASVISRPVLLMVGVPDDKMVIKAHWSMVFTLSIMFLPLGMIIAGKLADKKGPRLPIALGAVIYGVGLIGASFATNYAMLCFFLGFMISIGSGLAYGPIVASAVRWFPDKRGLASGIAVGALGFGPVIIAPLCATLLNTYHYDISTVLRILGVAAIVAIGAASFITSPPAAPKPVETAKRSEKIDYNWVGMLGTVDYWVLFVLFFLGAAPGLMLIGQANGIFMELGGFTPEKAAMLVALLAAANAIGRILWGTVSDYAGRWNTLIAMFCCSAIALLLLPGATQPALLLVVIFMIGTTYGGYLGLFPSLCADSFGLKNMSLNYAILFIAFSIAAIVGPRLYGMLDMKQAFFTAAAFAITGCAGTIVYRVIRKKA